MGDSSPSMLDAGDLVPEAERVAVELEHPDGHALVHRLGRVEPSRTASTSQVSARPGTTPTISSTSRAVGRQPPRAGQHRVADRAGDLPRRRGQHLGDVERVAARGAVEGRRRPSGAAGELGDGLRRRAGAGRCAAPPPTAARRASPRRRSPASSGRSVTMSVRGRGADAPPEQREQVERALVGPVEVLHHQHARRALRDLVEQGGHEVLAAAVAAQGVGEPPAGLARDVVERAERPRRQERVAGAHQEAALDAPCARGHGREQRRLADAGLPRDEHDPAAPARCLVERRADGLQAPSRSSRSIPPILRPAPGGSRALPESRSSTGVIGSVSPDAPRGPRRGPPRGRCARPTIRRWRSPDVASRRGRPPRRSGPRRAARRAAAGLPATTSTTSIAASRPSSAATRGGSGRGPPAMPT